MAEETTKVTTTDNQENTTISLDKNTANIAVDETLKLNATVSPLGTEITWTSDHTEYATVENGVVTGVAAGSATITAKAGSASATCTVTVSDGA